MAQLWHHLGMDIAEIATHVRRNAGLFHENGVTAVYAFGSRARGDHRPDSDLDLFIDYDAGTHVPSLLKIVGAELKLTDEMGFPVTITTRNALHPRLKDKILRDAIRIV